MAPSRVNLIHFLFLRGGQFGKARRVNTGVKVLYSSSCQTERGAGSSHSGSVDTKWSKKNGGFLLINIVVTWNSMLVWQLERRVSLFDNC